VLDFVLVAGGDARLQHNFFGVFGRDDDAHFVLFAVSVRCCAFGLCVCRRRASNFDELQTHNTGAQFGPVVSAPLKGHRTMNVQFTHS
jgi:hypothetical protein